MSQAQQVGAGVQRAADVAAGVSVPAWLVSIAADWLPIVQFFAGVLAIIASTFAIVVHVRKLRGK